MKPHFKVSQRGFTLIEIMLVTGMMLLMLGWGVPNMMRALEKHGIAKASMDVMDGCRQARALAILKGKVSELVITSYEDGYALHVRLAQSPRLLNENTGSLPDSFFEPPEALDTGKKKSRSSFAELDGFKRTLGGDIAIETLDVNFNNMLEGQINEASVRFFPNGTCDEFTTTLLLNEDRRIVSVDAITGLPSVVDPSNLDW